MKPSWLLRRSDVLIAVNERLSNAPAGKCEVRPSGISDTTQDCFGVFAKAAIPKVKRLFTDTTALCATSGLSKQCGCCGGELISSASKLSCCDSQERFCSWVCVDRAYATYHRALCGQIINASYASTDSAAGAADHEAIDRLWLRMLALTKQAMDTDGSPYDHPLSVPAVNQLSVRYDTVVRFSLSRDIVEPRRSLRKLGIDRFDLKFDTWVLRTIAVRMWNNVRQCAVETRDMKVEPETYLLAIDRLYSFFNHSCEPNVEVTIDMERQNSTLYLEAKRSLRKGEELFISYLDEAELELGHEERAEPVEAWTGGVCNCVKCRTGREIQNDEIDGDSDYQPNEGAQSEESSCDESV